MYHDSSRGADSDNVGTERGDVSKRILLPGGSALFAIAAMSFGCAALPVEPVTFSPGAANVRIGTPSPGVGATDLGMVKGSDGQGCGLFGTTGTQERAYTSLKNNAMAMGADYVQILTVIKPFQDGQCWHNKEYSISGMAYKLPPVRQEPANSKGWFF
jgi:hypothetical protein